MEEPVLDKIIGCSLLSKSKIDVCYSTGAVVFASHGFFSVVLPLKKQRYDFKLADDGRAIDAISFSKKGDLICVGEHGPNARIFLFRLDETYENILSRTEIRTQENGFSYVVVDSNRCKVISVGCDDSPFLLLWDITQPKPACIGFFHLPSVPKHVSFSPDSNFAVVCGYKLLKLVDTSVGLSHTPVNLLTRSANIGKYKTANYVSASVYAVPPYSIYALTENGTLCLIDANSVAFAPKGSGKQLPNILMTPIHLNSGDISDISLDKKIILIGCKSGTVLAIKKENGEHRIFGQFSSEGKAVLSIGISSKQVTTAYDDGTIVIFQRKLNSKPILSLPSHRGPICALSVGTNNTFVITGGSDGVVREWKIQKYQGVVAKSSQELICENAVIKKSSDYLTKISGVRCCATYNKYVFTGDNDGYLHVLHTQDLRVLQKISENDVGILSMDINIKENMLVTGGADGCIRLYNISGEPKNPLIPLHIQYIHSKAVISVRFVGSNIASCSHEGIKFLSKELKVISSYFNDQPILTLSAFPNGNFIVAGGFDYHVTIIRVQDGSVFRRYKLSQSAYPVHVVVDRSGLFVATALSDGSVRILDAMSGDVVEMFLSMAGLITNLCFHDDDIVLSSLSGCVMRWSLPQQLHQAISEKICNGLPIIDMINKEVNIPRSSLNGAALSLLNFDPEGQRNALFVEVNADPIIGDKTLESEEQEPDSGYANDQTGYDAPRPSNMGEDETRVDSIVRASINFYNNKKEKDVEEIVQMPSKRKELRSEGIIIEDEIAARKKLTNGLRTSKSTSFKSEMKADLLMNTEGKYDKKNNNNIDISMMLDKSARRNSEMRQSIQFSTQHTPYAEMVSAKDEFYKLTSKIKTLLKHTPQNPKEEAALNELKETVESFQKEGLKSDWFQPVMFDYMNRFVKFVNNSDN